MGPVQGHRKMAPKSTVKASNAKKSALKGTNANKVVKVRTDTSFHRPKTLKLARTPKYARKAVPHYNRMDAYKVIVSPIASETANKNQIKSAVKELYEVDVQYVHTLVRPNGTKKAYIRLTADHDALDVANRIGYI